MLKTYLTLEAAMSIAAFLTFSIDKLKAKKGKWRIPEKTLFAVAILFGGPGALAGMYVFRHKTKHKKFKIFIPLIAVIQVVVGVLIYFYFG